ncbi:MAG: hypothetical protein WCG04_00525 [Alphaproteobacteria bacterium]
MRLHNPGLPRPQDGPRNDGGEVSGGEQPPPAVIARPWNTVVAIQDLF